MMSRQVASPMARPRILITEKALLRERLRNAMSRWFFHISKVFAGVEPTSYQNPNYLFSMPLYIAAGAYLYGCGTPAVRNCRTLCVDFWALSGKMFFQCGQPALSFLNGNEFHHTEPDPFAVAVAHFPESAGEEGFFYGVSEYEAIGQRRGIHGRYQGYALQPVPSF